jgi:branched-chain amino acid transport system permease protein
MTATAPAPLPTTPAPAAPVPTRARSAQRLWAPLVVLALVALPWLVAPGSALLDDATIALAYTVMALGLNIIVGFAGLLDLGYVVFFAIGAYAMGWFASGFFASVNGGAGIHIAVSEQVAELPGVHVNFLLAVAAAIVLTTLAGLLIGIPTLRLRSDYIAIVTLAFGEIIGRIAVNGDELKLADTPLIGRLLGAELGDDQPLTGGRMGITPVDKIKLPGIEQFTTLDLRPWYWTALALAVLTGLICSRLRRGRLGRAWVALRDDETAAVAMGIPAVRTKLLAYGIGAAFGGLAGAFLASYQNTVNADQFEAYNSILILGMVVLGGVGTIWGVAVGAVTLTFINFWLIPDVLNGLPRQLGLDFELGHLSFGFYGLLLVLMMIMRPQGLFPDRGARDPGLSRCAS